MMQLNGAATTPNIQDVFIDKIIDFDNGDRYERSQPLTDLRKDPGEARIIYTCRKLPTSTTDDDDDSIVDEGEFVVKIKAKWPGPQNIHHEGPSPGTAAELEALSKFTQAKLLHVPHLIAWKRAIQTPDGVHPGGYIIYLVITKMPGRNLFDLGYWSFSQQKRAEIQAAFIEKLNEIRALGIAPYDCALRNVLWDDDARVLSIVDFEHYRVVTEEEEEGGGDEDR